MLTQAVITKKMKSYKLFWYLFFGQSKSFFITTSASSLIMISMLSLFECITRCSSLAIDDIKLFAIGDYSFPEWDILRLFMMSFKYGLILLGYSSTVSFTFITVTFVFNPIVTPKITYSYWFIIVFFFLLKKILNTSSLLSLIALVIF